MSEVVRTEGVLGGDPRIDGTRVGVLHVHELVVEGDHPPADVADQLDLTLGEVYTALAYYFEHPEIVREVREAQEAALDTLSDETLEPPQAAE